MKWDEFDWLDGEVTHWDLDVLDPRRPLTEQVEGLKEDLAQVQYGERMLVDVGWYPDCSPEGRFVVLVVRDGQWDAPVSRFEARSFEELATSIGVAAQRAKKALKA